ncbi:MAG: 30S ribosome-binding factor RbfA [Clostridiales bacterium]|nr:30S ribosome-binding factor RbfA [Clostridiales bacterium]
MNFRMDRLNGEMQKNISDIINNKIKDPRVAGKMISVLSVNCAKDLKTAKVYLSIYGEKSEAKKAFEAVCHCAGFIRKEMSMYFKDIRTIPQLTFFLDDSMEYSAKIDSILEQIKK